MSVIHFYSLYENNVSGIPSDIMDYIETSYDKLLAIIRAVLYLQNISCECNNGTFQNKQSR